MLLGIEVADGRFRDAKKDELSKYSGMAEESGPHPIGGVDYPRTLPEFDDWFSSEAACLAFLRRVRWRVLSAGTRGSFSYRRR